VGCFAVGLIPSGTRDPLGLRRAAQGVVRVLGALGLAVSLEPVLQHCAELHRAEPGAAQAEAGLDPLRDYLRERLAFTLREQGHLADTVEAVTAVRPMEPVDAMRRCQALTGARSGEGFADAFTVFKRVANIAGTDGSADYDRARLTTPQEADLERRLREVERGFMEAVAAARYGDAIERIRELAAPLHEFFERVLVMDPDPGVRENRLRLLRSIGRLAAGIGDFSRLQMERMERPQG